MRRAVGRLAGVLIAEALGLTGTAGPRMLAAGRPGGRQTRPRARLLEDLGAVTPAADVIRRGGRRRPDGAGNLAWAGGGGTSWRTWRRPGPGGFSGTDPRWSVATRSLPRAAGVGSLSAGQSAAVLGRPGAALSVAGRETGRLAVSHQPASIPAAPPAGFLDRLKTAAIPAAGPRRRPGSMAETPGPRRPAWPCRGSRQLARHILEDAAAKRAPRVSRFLADLAVTGRPRQRALTLAEALAERWRLPTDGGRGGRGAETWAARCAGYRA